MAKKTSKKSASRAKAPDTTGKQLVIVESPAKAKTINKYLGKDYVVLASVGHVRDLPSKNPKGVKAPVPGVDLEHDFQPTYEIIKGKGTTVTDLKRAAKKADGVWLATDLDREGEAIAWHLAEALGVDTDSAKRVVFNAITKDEVHRAFDHPRHLDMDKINAQQARRILDRIVGYQVSPLLWKKVAGGLSAGRVQSVATRLIVEREREIQAFIPEEFWKIAGYFALDLDQAPELAKQWRAFRSKTDSKGKGPTIREQNGWLADHRSLSAELIEVDGQRFSSDNLDDALAVAESAGFQLDDKQIVHDEKAKGPAKNQVTLIGSLADPQPDWTITDIQTKRTTSRPYAPFITSTLQQAAANVLGYAASQTMRLAQQLYEGVDISGQGSVGLITYMRTDSTHLSGTALNMARDYISNQLGEKYLPDKPNFYSSSNKAAQEAHEAIRPTDASLTPDRVRSSLNDQQFKLYRLIWQRFISSQMTPAQWDRTTVRIEAKGRDERKITFEAVGRVLVFDGFYRVAGIPSTADDPVMPPVEQGQSLAAIQVDPTQSFTSPPARYNEASLVKKLEAEGIGRPSTYASIIDVIQRRKYIEKISNRFHATDLGEVVTDKLIEAFPTIMEVSYTRDMESELDAIEEQHHDWVKMLKKFYGPFQENLKVAHEEMSHAKAETEPAPYDCQVCGAPTVYRFGKNGRFLSCSRYPDCKYAAPVDREGKPVVPEATDIACPKCDSPMLLRKGRFGPFLSCVNYPECDGIVNLDKKGFVKHPSPPPFEVDKEKFGIECPKCQSNLYLRSGKRGPWLSCSKFPKCRGRLGWTTLDDEQKKILEATLAKHEAEHPQPIIKRLDGTKIGDEYKPQLTGSESDEDGETTDD